MTKGLDLYDTHYVNIEAETYKEIRYETYGKQVGQTSWITLEEAEKFLSWLDINPSSNVLEVACGSGGITVLISHSIGAKAVGVDISVDAIKAATERAKKAGQEEHVQFLAADASIPLNFPDGSFDAIFCNDSINHLSDRATVLKDWFRLLKPSGRLVYTDPIIVSGIISNEEIAIRSSIGFYLFTPLGENQRLLEKAGFDLLETEDVTEKMSVISDRWREARAIRQDLLVNFEGKERYEGLQNFLYVVHKLASEKRLSRIAFSARKAE